MEAAMFRLRALAVSMDPQTIATVTAAITAAASLATTAGGPGPAVPAAVAALRAACGDIWASADDPTDTRIVPESRVPGVHSATLTVIAAYEAWAATAAPSRNGDAAASDPQIAAVLEEVVARERVLAITCAAATKQRLTALTTALCTRCAADKVQADKAKSPPPAPRSGDKQCAYDYLLIVDFECTCKENDHTWPNEIIEFPIIAVDTKTAAVVGEFHCYVKPVINPTLTAFCTKLTGITQDKVDAAKPLAPVIGDVSDWVRSTVPEGKTFAFATDGPWDLREFFYRGAVCRDGHSAPKYFFEWVDVRNTCADFHHGKPERLAKQLERLGMEFQGQEHSGIDDARNIARIVIALLQKGCHLWSTSAVKKLAK